MYSSEIKLNVSSLLQGVESVRIHCPKGGSADSISVAAVTADSRTVQADSLFVALVGCNSDGHDFLGQAVEARCSVVVIQQDHLRQLSLQELLLAGVVVIETRDSAAAYAGIAANFYGNPAKRLCLAGITGTNGKTTVTYLVEHVLNHGGIPVGVIGTVNIRYTCRDGNKRVLPTGFTTPEPMALQKALREMADHGVTHVLMEVSSHGLAQERVGSLRFDVGAFTNLSRDHLDYHHDMRSYFEAKKELFSKYLQDDATVVLPGISPEDQQHLWVAELRELCRMRGGRQIFWGDGEDADIRLKKSEQFLEKTEIVIKIRDFECTIHSTLVGRFNVENILATFGICLAMGIENTQICAALSSAKGAPGRVQRISTGDIWPSGGPAVLIDYAHTPDALEKVLSTVKDLPHSRLITVFGCGGDRDAGKRPLMGAIAARLSDVTIVTDDNPRTEDPEKIVAEILTGVRAENVIVHSRAWLDKLLPEDAGCVVVRDRVQAILAAITSGAPGDVVVIAGKGHEPYQLTVEGKKYFDDAKQAEEALFSWTPTLVAKASGGNLKESAIADQLLGNVSTDSRKSTRRGLFVALKGEKFDAHDFIPQAVSNGCTCLVVEKEVQGIGAEIAQVVVGDTTRALGDLAAFRRRSLVRLSDPTVVGLTGSCGKTTVKEMVAAIFNRNWPAGEDYPEGAVLKTMGNFNNLIGLPLSLLPITPQHRAAVLEMGMNVKGEIARLGEIADPDISCITNIHGAHLEGLGSIDGVAAAKEELFSATGEKGTLIINLDDPRVAEIGAKYRRKKVTYAVAENSEPSSVNGPDLWGDDVENDGIGTTSFTLNHRKHRARVTLHIAGEHNVSNALCAAAIGVAAGIGLETIVSGLEDFRPPEKRMEILTGEAGYKILNDSYNANPASMKAGLKTLQSVTGGRRVAILGDMLELGEASKQEHYAIGKLIAELDIDQTGVVGNFKEDLVRGALDNGLSEDRIRSFSGKKSAVQWLQGIIDEKQFGDNDLILVKASRGLQFETIVAELLG